MQHSSFCMHSANTITLYKPQSEARSSVPSEGMQTVHVQTTVHTGSYKTSSVTNVHSYTLLIFSVAHQMFVMVVFIIFKLLTIALLCLWKIGYPTTGRCLSWSRLFSGLALWWLNDLPGLESLPIFHHTLNTAFLLFYSGWKHFKSFRTKACARWKWRNVLFGPQYASKEVLVRWSKSFWNSLTNITIREGHFTDNRQSNKLTSTPSLCSDWTGVWSRVCSLYICILLHYSDSSHHFLWTNSKRDCLKVLLPLLPFVPYFEPPPSLWQPPSRGHSEQLYFNLQHKNTS